MISDTDISIDIPLPEARPHDDEDDPRPQDCAAVLSPLPPGLVMTEWAVALLRRYLKQKGLSHYHICYCTDLDLDDAEKFLQQIGEGDAAWEPLAAATRVGEPLAALTHGSKTARIWQVGVLHLPAHQVVLSRWYWVDEIEVFRELWLIAIPSASAYLALRDDVQRHRRRRSFQ